MADDLVVADRYYGGWFTIALWQQRGVDVVTRLHQPRAADFRRGQRLGADDHLVEWPKPPRPEWLNQETYDRLPDTLTMREMKFARCWKSPPSHRTARHQTPPKTPQLADKTPPHRASRTLVRLLTVTPATTNGSAIHICPFSLPSIRFKWKSDW
jgi:hypothetical protein